MRELKSQKLGHANVYLTLGQVGDFIVHLTSLPYKKEVPKSDMLCVYKQLLMDIGLHWRDIQCITNRALHEGISFFTQTLPKLGKAVDRALSDGYFKLPTNFKKASSSSALPAFLGSLFKEVFSLDGSLLPTASAIAVQQIRQICFFAYKANIPYSPEKEQAVLDRFVETERELHQMRISSDPILKIGNAMIRDVFSSFDPSTITAKHGPGITSNVPITEKYEHRLSPVSSVSTHPLHFFFNVEDAMTRLDRYPVWKHEDYFHATVGARVILVPKDSRGPRLISCEPAENQFIQQGIFHFMKDRLESHWLTSGQVNFSDQTINRELARKGSCSLEWATLDLKDASDRVHIELVSELFKDTRILDSLLSTRSSFTTLPDGTRVELKKFAPMGSACCFPVMATCIFFLLHAAFIGAGEDPSSVHKSIFVYGDDIIVPSRLASYAMSVLERYGLLVNREKSFISSRFLESCGFDSFDGNDVSPIRLKVVPCSSASSAVYPKVDAVSILETANHLFQMGYVRASEYLYSSARSLLGYVPFGYPHSPYLNRTVLPFMNKTAVDLNSNRNLRVKARFGELRHVWRLHRVVPNKCSAQETAFGHMMRTFPQLGTKTSVSHFGIFQRPRDYVLKYVDIDHVSMSEFPSAVLP